MNTRFALILCLLLLFSCLPFVKLSPVEVKASYGYTVHNLNTGLNYTTIQEAIDSLETLDGHVIQVDSGTYYEHVVVNKSISLIGMNKHNTIIDGDGNGTVVTITADHVTISGFTIQRGGTAYPDLGDCLAFASNGNTVRQNILRNSAAGIYLPDCHGNMISQNTITNTTVYGIRMFRSQSNGIIENNITYAQVFGIFVADSSESDLRKNFLVNNQGGVYMGYCTNNNVTENVIENSGSGIVLEFSSHNNVERNSMIDNTRGLHVGPMFGTRQPGTDDNVLAENNVVNNNIGISTILSNNNMICRNNFINNTSQFYSRLSTNVWADELEGNYWSSYAGVDLDHDGIGDTSYIVDDNNKDSHPLMGIFSVFNASSEFHVQTICNSTISEFQYNGTAIIFNVTGVDGTTGFCRICIPTALMNSPFKVYVNGTEISYDLLLCSNETLSYLYLNYTHSTQEVTIVPEFPSFLILPLSMTAILIAIMINRKISTKKRMNVR